MESARAQSNQAPSAPGVLSIRSPYPHAETLERLDAAVVARGLKVFASVDHSGEAKRVGLMMQPATLLIFGNPTAGTPLMVASPLLALDLPLRALVWQDRAGTVWASYTDPEYLAVRYEIPPDLVKNIAAIKSLILAALGTNDTTRRGP
jgi:uncharacterized protein (DUF302 family)